MKRKLLDPDWQQLQQRVKDLEEENKRLKAEVERQKGKNEIC